MLFKGSKEIGINGAKIIAELRLGSIKSCCGGIKLREVKREDMEELLENLKQKVLERFYG